MKIAPLLARRIGLGLLAAVLLGALVFVAMRSGPLAPTRVTVARVADDVVTPSLFGIGTVEARRSTLIGPTAAGRVIVVTHDEKIIPSFKRIYQIRDGRTHEEAGLGRQL